MQFSVLLFSFSVVLEFCNSHVNAQGIETSRRFSPQNRSPVQKQIRRKTKQMGATYAKVSESKTSSSKSKTSSSLKAAAQTSTFPTQDEVCPTGDEACCGLSFLECRELVFNFQLHFQEAVIGDTEWANTAPESPIVPINIVQDENVRLERPGEYSAITLDGIPFLFRIDEIMDIDEIIDTSANVLEETSPQDSKDIVDVAQLQSEYRQIETLFQGSIAGSPFLGLIVSTLAPDTDEFQAVLTILDEPDASTVPSNNRSLGSIQTSETLSSNNANVQHSHQSKIRKLQIDLGCAEVFDAAVATYQCNDSGATLSVSSTCRFGIITACEGLVAAAKTDFAKAVQDAGNIAEVAKAGYRLRQYSVAAAQCLSVAYTPWSYAICFARAAALIEIKSYAVKKAVEAALALAVQKAIEERDAVTTAATQIATEKAADCIDCCECCDSEDPCCGSEDPCCDSEDPCCGSEDPCCDSEDPCCGSEDPCCDSLDPCCGSEDPCCDSDGPCCGNEDPCCGSNDPCCGSEDPCCGSLDPCCGFGSECYKGGAAGDPHLTTFDNYRFSCQGKGEFILYESRSSGAQVQARFEKKGSFVSLATGFAALGGVSGQSVELSISKGTVTALQLFVDRNLVDFSNGFENDEVLVTVNGDEITTFFKASRMSVVAKYIRTSFKHLGITVQLPSSAQGDSSGGLLGSPDGNVMNDWTTAEGAMLDLPRVSARRAEEDYRYCTTEWCIRDPALSLFSYTEDLDFLFYSGCDDPYPGQVDTSEASAELRRLCGNNDACLIDGIELGLEGAQDLLEAEAIVGATSSTSRFRAEPTLVGVERPTNVALTVNLTGSGIANDIEEFAVFRVDGDTFEVGSTSIVTLRDDGSGIGEDQVAGDSVFSNIVAVESATAGEAYSFQVVPRIQGNLAFDSPFVFTAYNAVRSFSIESGIVGNEDVDGSLTFESIEGLELVIRYSWPTDQNDLDTSTTFLGRSVGYSCGSPSAYMSFTGDNTNSGGSETVRIRLGASFQDGTWNEQVSTEMKAGWYGPVNKGPATVSVVFEKVLANGTIDSTSNPVSFAMNPGFQSSCASTTVGSVDVSVNADDGSVAISVLPL